MTMMAAFIVYQAKRKIHQISEHLRHDGGGRSILGEAIHLPIDGHLQVVHPGHLGVLVVDTESAPAEALRLDE